MTKNTACPAKINLFLEITGKREDSYHTLDMVMHTVSLADTLSISLTKGEGNIYLSGKSNNPAFPSGEKNIAYRAAEKYLSAFDIKGYDISVAIDKKIPISAGLGGGSTDAAGVLRALESIFAVGDKETLDKIALSLGADVPFCMYGGCLRAQGIGEILTPVREMPEDTFLVITRGKSGVNTAKAYADSDRHSGYEIKSADNIIKSLDKRDKSFADQLFNRFEEVVFADLPEVKEIKDTLLSSGALGALMSGSGSAVYAVFENSKNASAACEKLCDRGVFAAQAKPFSSADF